MILQIEKSNLEGLILPGNVLHQSNLIMTFVNESLTRK